MDTVQYKTLDEFIVLHKANHINYCEIVVKPNGRVEYAIPSHLSKLEQIWGVPDEELFDNGPIRRSLYNEMPMTVSPIHWLSEDLRCIVCWFNGLIIKPRKPRCFSIVGKWQDIATEVASIRLVFV